jgi:hypothetical protein
MQTPFGIVLSILLRFMDSDYLFGIFKLLLYQHYYKTVKRQIGAIGGTGTAYPSVAPKYTPSYFSMIRVYFV